MSDHQGKVETESPIDHDTDDEGCLYWRQISFYQCSHSPVLLPETCYLDHIPLVFNTLCETGRVLEYWNRWHQRINETVN